MSRYKKAENMQIKLVFIKQTLGFDDKSTITKNNVPFYNCVACDGWWTLDMWKGVEEHLDGIECAEYLGWLKHYSENPDLDWLLEEKH